MLQHFFSYFKHFIYTTLFVLIKRSSNRRAYLYHESKPLSHVYVSILTFVGESRHLSRHPDLAYYSNPYHFLKKSAISGWLRTLFRLLSVHTKENGEAILLIYLVAWLQPKSINVQPYQLSLPTIHFGPRSYIQYHTRDDI